MNIAKIFIAILLTATTTSFGRVGDSIDYTIKINHAYKLVWQGPSPLREYYPFYKNSTRYVFQHKDINFNELSLGDWFMCDDNGHDNHIVIAEFFYLGWWGGREKKLMRTIMEDYNGPKFFYPYTLKFYKGHEEKVWTNGSVAIQTVYDLPPNEILERVPRDAHQNTWVLILSVTDQKLPFSPPTTLDGRSLKDLSEEDD